MYELAGKISDSELEVMRVLWETEDALPVTEIRRRLQPLHSWEGTTIKTMITRLTAKGALLQEKRDVFYYSAAISEAEYNRCATESLIRRLYQGSAGKLVAALVKERSLSDEDMAELRALFKVEE